MAYAAMHTHVDILYVLHTTSDQDHKYEQRRIPKPEKWRKTAFPALSRM